MESAATPAGDPWAKDEAPAMKCEHCHEEVASGSTYCAHCGRAISAGTPTPPLAPANRQPKASGAGAGEPPGGKLPAAGNQPIREPSALVVRLTNGREYRLSGQSDYLIGRVDDAPARPGAPEPRRSPDVDLAPFHGLQSGVSRAHIAIHVRPEGVFVEDVDSLNETIHNGFRLMSKQWYALRDRDELLLGRIALRVLFEYS